MDHPPQDSQNPYASPAIPTDAARASFSINISTQPLVRPIHIFSALTPEEYYEGIQLGKPQIGRRTLFSCILIYIFVYGMMFSLLAPELYRNNIVTGIIILIAVFVVGTGLGILLWRLIRHRVRNILWWFSYRRVKKLYESAKGPFAYNDIVISEEGLEFHQEKGDAKLYWSSFTKYRYADHVVVVFYDGYKNLIQVFPRSKFQKDGDWDRFIGLLDRKMPRC